MATQRNFYGAGFLYPVQRVPSACVIGVVDVSDGVCGQGEGPISFYLNLTSFCLDDRVRFRNFIRFEVTPLHNFIYDQYF